MQCMQCDLKCPTGQNPMHEKYSADCCNMTRTVKGAVLHLPIHNKSYTRYTKIYTELKLLELGILNLILTAYR